jgi:hypothetical protein
LAKIADTLSEESAIGRLSQVCERWIYSSCLCFALDWEEQQNSGFRYQYSNHQVEYSRNLLFELGGRMDQVFQTLIDRSRTELGHDQNDSRLPAPAEVSYQETKNPPSGK